MSVAVVLAFAGALAAAVGAAMLAGRFIRAPRSDLAAWSAVLLVLAVALGAQTMGFAIGFSGPAFRVAAVSGLLLAPLWAAWGLVELAGLSVPGRFATRLLTGALTVLPGVILALDPLTTTPALGRNWPGEARYMSLPRTALTVVHVAAVAIALLMMTLAAVRTRRDATWWDVFVPAAAAGAAVLLTVSLGLTLPAAGYPLLAAAAAGGVWFAAARSDRVDRSRLQAGEPAAGDVGGAYPRRGHRRRGQPLDLDEPAAQALGDWTADDRLPTDQSPGERAAPDGMAGDRAGGDRPTELAALAAGGTAPGRTAAAAPGPPPEDAGPRNGGQLFGLIAIYTLLDGSGESFDELAQRTVEAIRKNEPDTLLFVVHTVPKAPMQRIFYEVYRDRVAYAKHRRRPEVEEFFARHRPYVLATNVIELELRYAKASALPSLGAMFTRDGGR